MRFLATIPPGSLGMQCRAVEGKSGQYFPTSISPLGSASGLGRAKAFSRQVIERGKEKMT